MKIEYDAILIKDESNNGYHCEVPFDVEKTFGKKRVKIKALIDDIEYRGLLTPMCGIYRVMLNKTVRDKIGKVPGDTVHIRVEEDKEERKVIVPDDLRDAMAIGEVESFFDNLSFTHQKEYVQWILDAKKEETRKNRIEKAIEMMKNKIKSR
jgi:hypothetical protein